MPRSRYHNRFVRPVVAALACALLLAAFGAFANKASSASSPKASSVSSSTTFVMDRAADITTFDPDNAIDQTSVDTIPEIYDGLVRFGPGDHTILPSLATTWKFSDKNTKVTFTLRSGARFSNGSQLTTADVVESIRRASGPGTNYSVLWGGVVKSVTALGANKVVITLHHTFAPLLSVLATWDGSVFSASNYKKYGRQAFITHPLGTGPYMVKTWHQGSQLTLVANPYYWGARPKIRKVIFNVIGDDNTRLLNLKAGAVDAIDTVGPQQVATLKAAGLKVQAVQSGTIVLIPLNEHYKPFSNVDVRLALAYAMNRPSIAKYVYFGVATPAASAMAAGTNFYEPDWPIAYDLKKAKAYLTKSPYPHGFSFTLQTPSGNTAELDMCEVWASSLKQIGVTVHIQDIEATTEEGYWAAGKYQANVQPWANAGPDPFLYAALGLAGQDAFYTYWKSASAVKLADAGETALKPTARERDYHALQALAAAQMPQIYVVNVPTLTATSPKVSGFSPDPDGDYLLESASLSG